jgi:DNA-binding PadR family transcriptional regulator
VVVGEGLVELGRFTEPALLILVSLAAGPKHGYAMMEDVRRLAGVQVGPGTLYAALARLERRGWIAGLPAEERRRPYELTPVGATALRAHLESMQSFAVAGLQRLAAR